MTEQHSSQPESAQEALRRSEERLRESERLLRHVTDNLPNAVVYQFTVEPDGKRRFTFISKAVERLNEVTVEEVLADADVMYRQMLPEYSLVARKNEALALQNLSPVILEVQSRLPSGRLRWFEHTATPRRLPDGGLVWDGVELDITKRKQAEEALRRSEEKFAKVFGACPMSITIAGLEDGRYVDVNDVFLQIAGLRKEEVIGRTSTELNIWMAPEDRRHYVETLTHQGFLRDYPLNWRAASGEYHHFLTSTEIIELEGKPCTLNFISEITERKRIEEEKIQLQAQLQQAQKLESVGRLAGGVAHDFNNMLNVILGYAELAQGRVDPSDALYADLQEVITAAQRSAKVTRQLLAFARKQTVAPRVLDLNETIAGMYKMLERIIGEQIQIEWRPGDDLWPVNMDPSQIDQIVANLCVNARDAIAGSGNIMLSTGNIEIDAAYCAAHPGHMPGAYVWLAVRDDGCGMDEEMLNHIFEPFFTTKEVGEGTGLGLAMVYGSVRQHNGFVTVESKPGRGTCFTIFLPRCENEGPQISTEAATEAIRGKETILLVEDEPAVLTLTKKLLEYQGYTVMATQSADDAWRLAKTHEDPIHLLMTDVIMPSMNGWELAQQILALRPGTKVLFMSGYPSSTIAQWGVLEEGVHLIQKPFLRKDLAAKVRDVLDQK